MSQEDIFINGELLRLRREARGWSLGDMATRACMSVKQIRQIEEGGLSSFYSTAVKLTAAKKIGALLGLSAEEVLDQIVESVVSSEESAVDELLVDASADEAMTHPSAENAKHSQPASAPVSVEVSAEEAINTSLVMKTEPQDVGSANEASKSQNSLWLIAALVAVVWATATYWQTQEEPANEPVPPLQVLPAEDPASGTSAAEGAASVASEVAPVAPSVMSVAKPPVTSASVASAAIVPVATPVTRPASALVAVPASSSASKSP